MTIMDAKQKFKQAYREIRSGGRIGYMRLDAPRIRFAAGECFRSRLDEDDMTLARRRYWILETDLFWRHERAA